MQGDLVAFEVTTARMTSDDLGLMTQERWSAGDWADFFEYFAFAFYPALKSTVKDH